MKAIDKFIVQEAVNIGLNIYVRASSQMMTGKACESNGGCYAQTGGGRSIGK